MKTRKGKQSGTFGDRVYVSSKYGQIVRRRPRRGKGVTEARVRARAAYFMVPPRWRRLTDEQRGAWNTAVAEGKGRSGHGRTAPSDGYHFFNMINCTLLAAGQSLVSDPPQPVKFRRNPVRRLIITRRQGRIRLELEVSDAPAAFVFVLGSPPCSAGISVRSNYAIIGLLPAPVRGRSDITELYIKKFGVPPVGTRVFIRTRQMINGWEDKAKETNALVPAG